MIAKQEYIDYCNEHYVPLFHKPFWWDAVTDNWNVHKFERDGKLVFMPYQVEKKMGFTISRNPLLTPYSGLLFSQDLSIEQKKIIADRAISFLQQFSLSEYDCNPNIIQGFNADINKTTYLLSLKESTDIIYDNFKSSLKRQIKKAEKKLTIQEDKNIERFYQLYTNSMRRRKGANRTPKRLVEKVFKTCWENGCGHIFTAIDKSQNAHASIWYVEDERCAYYLLGGSNAQFLGSGAMGYLLWNCIKLAHSRGKEVFDFEGSMEPGVARFFSTFGGQVTKYPVLKGITNPLLRKLIKIREYLP